MKLTMKHWLDGTQPNGEPWPSTGGVVDVDDDTAKQLLTRGAAVPCAVTGDEVPPDVTPDPDTPAKKPAKRPTVKKPAEK